MDYMNGIVLLQHELTRKARQLGEPARRATPPRRRWDWLTRRLEG